MSRTRKQADPPIPRFAELCRLYARHTPDVALGSDDPADAHAALADAAAAHRRLAGRRTPGDAVLDIRDSDDGRALVDLVCDETPLLVQSVLAGVGRVGRRIRRVVHAPVVLRRGSGGELAEVLPAVDSADRPSDALVEVWMRVELEPVPGEEGEDLGTELREVLAAVRDVAADEWRIADTVHAVAAELAGSAVRGTAGGGRAARLAGRRPLHLPRVPARSGTRDGLGILRQHGLTRRTGTSPAPAPTGRWSSSPGPTHPASCCGRTGPSRS